MSRTLKKKYKKKLFYKKLKIFSFLLIVSTCLLLITLKYIDTKNSSKEEVVVPQNLTYPTSSSNIPKSSRVSISFVGDIMVHDPQLLSQFDNSTNSYSFNNNYEHVKPIIEKSDLAMCNLETTLGGKDLGYSSYPIFSSPDELASSIKYSGFDIVSTINNHSYDKSEIGYLRTLDVLYNEGLDTVGTRPNKEDENYLIREVDGIKLGITSFSYGEIIESNTYLNGIKLSETASDNSNVFDMRDVNSAFNAIKITLDKINNTDVQILYIHWGNEYQRFPNEFQKELSNLLCDYGVDIIIGSHPHVVQPVDVITSAKNNNKTYVFYSLGNFISNQRREYMGIPFTEDGLIATVELEKQNDLTTIKNITCIPTWVNKYSSDDKSVYEIIPIYDKEYLYSLDNLDLDKVKNSYENTISLIETSDIISYPIILFD